MTYGVRSIDYLGRARKRLDDETKEGLIYAALEIRNGVEARIQEYLEPQPHIPNKAKRAYRLNVLGSAVQQVSPKDERVTRITLSTADGEYVGTLYFTPVTSRLRALAARCGDVLHALIAPRTDAWWSDIREMLEEVWELLREANLGQLLGTPLLGPDGSTTMNVWVPRGLPVDTADLKGARVVFKVEYLDEMPEDPTADG